MSLEDIAAAAAALRSGAVSARELATDALARSERLRPRLNCWVALEPEAALQAADAADARRAAGTLRSELDGIPVGYKDMFYRAGRVTGCGSAIRRDWVADHTATVVERLEAAGAVPLGRLHMTEFAGGPTGHNEHLGPCRNPWNLDRITGGSSSGPGSAVAAGLVLGALGSDTGGSVRLPAAMCGITALFPTRSRVSRHGVMPLSPSMDTAGPMARTARDCAAIFAAIAGPDPKDGATLNSLAARPLPGFSFAGVRIGVPRMPFAPAPAGDSAEAFARSLADLAAAGAEIVEIDVPLMAESLALGGTVSRAEAAAAHARWLTEQPERYGMILRFRLGVGLAVPAHRYIDALALRAKVARQFDEAVFGRVDLLHLPAYWQGAPTIASLEPTEDNMETIWANVGDWTRPFNYLGCPVISLPCGFTADGMPLGMQLVGRHFDDERLLAAGIAWQDATDWHRRRPSLD